MARASHFPVYIACIVSAPKGPPFVENASLLSITATALHFFNDAAISSPGNGLKERTFISPTLSPLALILSIASLVVPAAEPMITTAYSASCILYSSINPYLRPDIFSNFFATSKITFLAFSIA